MTPPATRPRFVRASHAAAGILLAAALVATPILAGGNATTQHFKPAGSGDTTANGDFISSSGGLNTAYHYFIEVPPGSSRLVVDMWDADVNSGGATELAADRDSNDSTTTRAQYTLFDPSGGEVWNNYYFGTSANPAGADNTWQTLYDSNATGPTLAGSATSSKASGSGTSINLTLPSGITAGDLLVAIVARGNGGTPGIATPTGWTVRNEGNSGEHLRQPRADGGLHPDRDRERNEPRQRELERQRRNDARGRRRGAALHPCQHGDLRDQPEQRQRWGPGRA